MASSTEELDLLERVFLRIGSAESDEQLESAINKFLIPVLLKLSSPNEGVRKKVMELLVHVNKRVKRRPTVQLPVEVLLTHYRDPKASSFLINFSILYIKIGFPRLSPAKQEELAPGLLLACEGKPKIHQDGLLLLLMSVIGSIKVPADEAKRKEMFKLDEKPELMKQLSSFMLDVLLLPYAFISSAPEEESASGSGSGQAAPQAPPGMSEYGMKRVTSGEVPMTPERLEQTKLGIVQFLGTGVLSNDEMICHLIIAAADTRFTVANLADTELKRIAGSVNWSNIVIATKLFHIYLGSPEVPADKRNPIPQANRIAPANTRIRLKILPYLSRLEKEAILFPGSIQVIFNSLYDVNTNPKLKLQALNFALAIVRRSDIQAMNKMGGMLYTGLLKLVWNTEESEQLRVVGYTIIGQIVKRLPHIINKNLIELQVFFENLTCDQTDIRNAVRDSLLTMIDAFKMFMEDEREKMDVDEEPKKDDKDSLPNRELIMMALLSSQIEAKEPTARFVAVKYTAAVFRSDHVPSRYLLLLSAGDSNSDVSSVATKSLYSSFECEESEVKKILLPDFSEIIRCVYEKAIARMKNPNQMVTVQNTNLPFNVTTFIEILTYLRLCLAKSSKTNINSKELISHPCDQSPFIGRYVSEMHKSDPSVFDNYLSLIEMVLPVSSSIVPLSCLVEVFGVCPESFAAKYSEKLQWIMNFLNNTKEEIREIAAVLLSIVCTATMDDGKLSDTLAELLKMLDNKLLETQHGAILALGNIIERKIVGYGAKNWIFPQEIIGKLVAHLDSPNALLVSPACIALGLISKSIPLPIPDESDNNLSKHGLLDKLIEIIKNMKLSAKIKERAIQTCGLLCLGENFPYSKELIDKFLGLSKETKDIDIHFSIGESIILCIEGISSAQKRDLWKVEKTEYGSVPVPDQNLNLLSNLLDNLLTLSRQPHPSVRQSVCVYLLLIVKRLSSLSVVKEKLPLIQATFMDLLSENNELVQDMASKGLALVYENTTEENKKELVNGLLDQLLTGRREVQKVTSDTKLFEEGQLGTAPTGGSLSTYKEICSLASDLNQPDLVYKFMHLANHNAIWNSKKGAAFGFQTIAIQANDQLNEYLPKIIPRLYRYQFDPTPKIQQSMANIWHSLVKDNQKTIDKYYNQILDDLLYNLTSNQWRVRHSCCLALGDFFRGSRSILDAKDKLPELWKSLFRVMDDVHEGTRLAAQNTSKTLSKLCVRVCNTELGKVNQEMLDVVLSVFLSGITNPVAEVRNLSLQTVSQLVNSAGSSLKPNLTTLIPNLLEAAGELESVGLSYLSAQYGAQTQTQEMIDSVRANVAKTHYTTQTVAKCVQYVELDMLPTLVSRVTEIMKSVNLGSRVACAHLIILLSHHLGRSMEQYTGKFLLALLNGLLDRNATVRKTYASTIGQIVHTARTTSMEKLTTKLSNWYFEKEDLNTRTAIGLTLQAISQYNGELLKEQFAIVIPLIFFAMHSQKIEGEDNSHVVMWEDIWNEVTPGSEAGMKQHMNEICKILETALTSPSWTMKAQGARCVSTIAIKIGDSLESSHRDQLIDILLKSLQGKTFPGKEDLLKSLSKLGTHCSEKLKESPEKCQEIVDALLRECNKSELGYKRHGLEALGLVLEAFDSIDCFKQVYDIVKDLLKKLDEENEEGETSEELTKRRNEKYKTIEVVYETLGNSWPRNKATQLEYQDLLLNECYKALERSPRDIQVAILTALRCYLEKLHYFNGEQSTTPDENKSVTDILDKTTQALHFSLGVAKHTRLRKEALNIIFTLGNKLISAGRSTELQAFTNALRSRLQELEKDPTPEVRTRLMDLKEMFKN